ncbi:MAG TPA: hypothetical protein VFK56_14600 [Mycobacterium sp.]|nr:hypothetical protein [Mycobacterium sp.]
MTETPQGASNPLPEPNSDPTTEPAPVVTSVARHARWRWPQTTRNRIAASVGIAAAAVAIVAGVFTGGVVAGQHSVDGAGQSGWREHSAQLSADRAGAPISEIWIFPDGAAAAGSGGYLVTGFGQSST